MTLQTIKQRETCIEASCRKPWRISGIGTSTSVRKMKQQMVPPRNHRALRDLIGKNDVNEKSLHLWSHNLSQEVVEEGEETGRSRRACKIKLNSIHKIWKATARKAFLALANVMKSKEREKTIPITTTLELARREMAKGEKECPLKTECEKSKKIKNVRMANAVIYLDDFQYAFSNCFNGMQSSKTTSPVEWPKFAISISRLKWVPAHHLHDQLWNWLFYGNMPQSQPL